MRKKRFLLILCLALAGTLSGYDVKNKALAPVKFSTAPKHADLKMVENGKLNFAIVSDLQAEQRLRKNCKAEFSIKPAIAMLVEGFEKCIGVKPQVLDIKDAGKAKYMIVVGDCKIARDHGVDVSKLPDQGLAVKTFDRGIILAGRDSSLIDGFNMDPLDRLGSSLGTKFAATDFLERFLGMRAFYPGEYGTIWPKISDLTIKPVSYTDSPYLLNRSNGYYLQFKPYQTPEGKKFWESYLGPLTRKDIHFPDWRWREGWTVPFGGMHCPDPQVFAKYYPNRLKDIFYTSPYGNFWYNSNAHIGNYFDVINFKFADLMIESLKKFYASKGKIDEGKFRAYCNNSYISFGVCDTFMPDQEVLNDPVVQKLKLMTKEEMGNRGKANIYARFHQYLAKRIQKEFPGKKLCIMAYYDVKYAGTDPRWTLPPNTDVKVCGTFRPQKAHNKKEVQASIKLMKEWYESLGNRPVQALWLYDGKNEFTNAVAGYYVREIPKIFGKYFGNVSIFYDHMDGCPGSTWFHYPSTYAVYRAMWSPDWDIDAAIDEHWEPFYGKVAGDHLRKFHKLVRDCYEKYGMNLTEDQPLVYPANLLKKMEFHLAEAQKAVKPGSVEAKRMKIFCAPWPKAIQSMKNISAYERPVYYAYQLLDQESVKLDGKGDEPFWKNAMEMKMLDPLGSGIPLKYPVSIKFAWNKKGIYGLFKTSYKPVTDKPSMWGNETYEVFFSPGTKLEEEFQFIFDPVGRQQTGYQRHLPIPQQYNKHWKAPGFKKVSTYNQKQWTVEFFMPFELFKGYKIPNSYDFWHCNVVRNKVSPKEYSGSALTLGNNHNMGMFGIFRFCGKGDSFSK